MPKSRKIFDIIPPKEKKSSTQPGQVPFRKVEGGWSPEGKYMGWREGWSPFQQEKKRTFKNGLILSILLLLISATLVFSFSLSKAEIEIWPETEVLKFQKEIEINGKITKSDSDLWIGESVIPGKFFEKETETSQQFSSSGITKKEILARGQMRVYNEYHLPITLIVGTHFRADSGKQFHSLKKITIPAKGYIDIEVEADAPGQDYNIGPSNFSVPGLRKYSPPELFYSIWGESSVAMKGGLIDRVPQVTQEDLETAESILVEKSLREGEESLKRAIPPDFILLEETLKQQILEKFSLAKAGQELESFISRVKTYSRTLTFKKSDLEDFAKELIYSQIGPDQKLHQESLELKYKSRFIDFEAGKANLSLDIEAKVYSAINLQILEQKIKGKSSTESKNLLAKQPEIFKAQITLWPFWVKKIPENTEKIKIKLNID